MNLGKVARPDMNEAQRYYRAAAEQGHLFAAFNYGNNLMFGRGVPRDPAAALPWLLKAANANLAPGERLVGIIYRDGDGAPQDKARALAWFRRAADKGDIYSAGEVGAAYWNGADGYAQDSAEAVRWFLKAAADPKLVNPAVNFSLNLGVAYRDGTGVAQDRAQSIKWFRDAAERGSTFAAAEIGPHIGTARRLTPRTLRRRFNGIARPPPIPCSPAPPGCSARLIATEPAWRRTRRPR